MVMAGLINSQLDSLTTRLSIYQPAHASVPDVEGDVLFKRKSNLKCVGLEPSFKMNEVTSIISWCHQLLFGWAEGLFEFQLE